MAREQLLSGATEQAGGARAMNREWYHALFDHSPNAVLLAEPPTGAILAANTAACRMLGYTAEQLCTLNLTALLDQTDPRLPLALETLAHTGQFHAELTARRAGGVAFPVDFTQSLFMGPDGVTVAAAYFVDISARKEAEGHRALLASIAASSHDAIIATDLEGKITSWNSSAERIYGYAERDMIGSPIFPLLMPGRQGGMQSFVTRIGHGEILHLHDVAWQMPTGETVVLAVTLGPVRADDGTLIGISSIAHDITQRKQLEEDLRQSEQRYRLLADNIPDIVFALDAKGDPIYVSPSVQHLRGCSVEEALAEERRNRFTADSLIDVTQHLAASIAEAAAGRPLSHPYHAAECRRRDGSTFWAETCLSPRYAADHTFEGFVGVTRDISERKRLEEALRRREEWLHLVIENSPDVIWIWDQDGGLQFVSGASQAAFGVPPAAMLEAAALTHALAARIPAGELTAARLAELGAPNQVFADIWLKMQRAVKLCVRNPGEKVRSETRLVLPGGQVRHLDSTYQGFRRGAVDVEVVAVTHDVTELVGAKEQVQVALEQLRLAADAAEIGVWTLRFADDHLELDDRCCEIYGIPRDKPNLGADDWRAVVHPDDLARSEEEMAKARLGQDLHSILRVLLPDGGIRYVYSAAVIERDGAGTPVGLLGINRDVTNQKTYEQYLREANAVLEQSVAARTDDLRQTVEELKRANAGKDAFLAAVSHEMRTPLTGILNFTETLGSEMRGPLNEHQKRYVAAIQLSGDRLLYVVNSVLNYTHAMTSAALPLAPCRMAELCTAAVTLVEPKAAAKQQCIETAVVPADLHALSNGASIMQILAALLDNAVKFTPPGGRLGVEMRTVDAGCSVQIVVWDTGIGIRDEDRPYLFKPLTQVDQRLARAYEGIGLGLALVARTVEMLGGTVAVKSGSDSGSRFIVTLPSNLEAPRQP